MLSKKRENTVHWLECVYTLIHRWCLYGRMKSNAGWSPFAISFFVRRFELLHEFLQTKIPYMAYQTLFHAGHNHAILLPTQIQTEWKTHHKVTHMRNSILFSAHQQKKVHLNPTEKTFKRKKTTEHAIQAGSKPLCMRSDCRRVNCFHFQVAWHIYWKQQTHCNAISLSVRAALIFCNRMRF